MARHINLRQRWRIAKGGWGGGLGGGGGGGVVPRTDLKGSSAAYTRSNRRHPHICRPLVRENAERPVGPQLPRMIGDAQLRADHHRTANPENQMDSEQ